MGLGSKNTNSVLENVESIIYTDTYWDDIRVPVFTTKKGGSKYPDFTKVLDNGAGRTDSYTADEGLMEIDFHYQIDTPGSKDEYIK